MLTILQTITVISAVGLVLVILAVAWSFREAEQYCYRPPPKPDPQPYDWAEEESWYEPWDLHSEDGHSDTPRRPE